MTDIHNRRGKFAQANDLEIFYREIGEGVPLILLHGGTRTHETWNPFIPHFSERFRVITPDSRGHGRTKNPGPGLSYRQMGDDLAAFIQVLDLDRPIIFGFSDGGQIALELGMRYPALARSLVIGGAWYRFAEEYQEGLKKVGYEGPGKVNYGSIDKYAQPGWRDRMWESHPHPDPDYYETLLEDISRMWWTPLNYQGEDFERIKRPTLIFIGENDEAVPVQESREMAQMIPSAELAVIQNVGHFDILVEGGEFLDIVDDFFHRLLGI
jgi:pimeloyl-ACP methyl ester carboxylesterase